MNTQRAIEILKELAATEGMPEAFREAMNLAVYSMEWKQIDGGTPKDRPVLIDDGTGPVIAEWDDDRGNFYSEETHSGVSTGHWKPLESHNAGGQS